MSDHRRRFAIIAILFVLSFLFSLIFFGCQETASINPGATPTGTTEPTGLQMLISSSNQTTASIKPVTTSTIKGANYQADNDKEISQIVVFNAGFGIKDSEYKLDFSNHQLYSFLTSPVEAAIRDPATANEGYQTVDILQRDKIDAFLKIAHDCGFVDWKESFVNENITDGYQWGITITFVDGTTKKIIGSNAFPETWDVMYAAFKDLTDCYILDTKSNGQMEQ